MAERRRRRGRLRGQITVAEDFDETPPDVIEAFQSSETDEELLGPNPGGGAPTGR